VSDPIVLAVGVIVLAAVALFAIEIWTVKTGRPTISERAQELNRRMGLQLVAGISFVIGTLAGWFIAHFTS
jgi:hypothetical protein